MSQLRTRSKQILLIMAVCLVVSALFLWATGKVFAAGTTYYVATNGNDANNGTSLSTPFLTIQKCASVAQAGDSCLVRAGTYRETVTPPRSGTSTAAITFAPYNGESVTVSGANLVTGWSLSSGSIYTASVTLPVNGYADTGFLANQLFVDSQMQNEARWPNTGTDLEVPTEATAGTNSSCGSSSSTIYDSSLPSGSLTGATVHIRGGYNWTAQTGTVSSSSSGQLSFTGGNYDCTDLGVMSGSKYYLTGLQSFLDSAGEWFYNGSSHQLLVWTPRGDSPANHTVEAKQRNYAFDLSGRSYINVQGFNIFAATVLTNSSSSYNTLSNLQMRYVSHYVTTPSDNTDYPGCDLYCTHIGDTGVILAGTHNTLQQSSVAWSAGNGVSLQGTNESVIDSLIQDTDYAATYNSPIEDDGTNSSTIKNDTISRTGRDGIHGTNTNTNTIVAYNDISNFGQLNQDVGGIYTCCSATVGTGSSIDHNWIHDNQATSSRGFNNAYTGAGIYIDNGANGFLIHHNIVWNGVGDGIRTNGYGTNMSQNNLLYNNTLASGQSDSLGIGGASDCTGSKYINNIYRTAANTCTNSTVANDLSPSTDPLFVNASANNYQLQNGSPARGAGQAISGITASGVSNPDEGAYEGGSWTPGCDFSGCQVSTNTTVTVDDTSQGSGTNQFNYTGSGWSHATGVTGQGYYNNSVSYDSITNDSVSFTFNGTHATLYGCQWGGIAGISLDGGPEVLVDFYQASQANNIAVWSSPMVSAGQHIFTVRVTGTKNASSSYTAIPIDRVDIDQLVTTTTSFDDTTSSFAYTGSGWSHATGVTGQGYYNNSVSYDGTANDSATIQFTGVAVTLHASQWGGIMGVKLDGGNEQMIDLYTPSQGNDVIVWSSPILNQGSHSLTIRVTGTKNSGSSYTAIPLDRVDVANT